MTATPIETPAPESFPSHLVDKARAENHPLSVWVTLTEKAHAALSDQLKTKIDHYGGDRYGGILNADEIAMLHKAGGTNICNSRAGIPRPPKF